MDFNVKCVSNGGSLNYIIGKTYEFRNGVMHDDLGFSHHASSFEDWIRNSVAGWALIEKEAEAKSGGFIHCKICKRRFELKWGNRYTAISTESIFPLRTASHDAFDCPHCGCQNIVGIREGKVKSSE